MMSDYLTEQSLSKYLDILSNDWIHNKTVPHSSTKSRPDYRSEKLKMIVEFDGYHHYCYSKRIIADKMNELRYTELGYKVIRIPYFIQMSSEVFRTLFGCTINIIETYPQGFIDTKAMLPSDYCELGIKRFVCDLERFGCVREEVINSLKLKVQLLGDKDLVIPPSLSGIL